MLSKCFFIIIHLHFLEGVVDRAAYVQLSAIEMAVGYYGSIEPNVLCSHASSRRIREDAPPASTHGSKS